MWCFGKRVKTMYGPAATESMSRFPCASLTSPFVTIASNGPGPKVHEFDEVFDAALQSAQRLELADVQRKRGCEVRLHVVQSWLTSLVRPLGRHALLGTVPVKVHGLRVAKDCIDVGKHVRRGSRAHTLVSRIEFVIHRYGDDTGVHYMAHVSGDVPCRLHAYKRLGAVPADILWNLDMDA